MFLRRTLALASAAADGAPATGDAGRITPGGELAVRAGRDLAAGGPGFSSIDSGTLYGTATLDDYVRLFAGYGRVSRREAIVVGAVKAARDILAGGIGQLPIRLYGPDGKPTPWAFFDQPEERIPSVITWTNVVDDLIFESRSFIRVTHVGWHGKPAVGARLEPDSVTVKPGARVYRSATGTGSALEYVPDSQLIRIDSPNDALLTAGARAIRVLSALEAAGLNSVDGTPPVDYFTPDGDADPLEDEEVTEFLAAWAEARRQGSTAYIPAALKYNLNGWTPEQLQLNGAREIAIAEIARHTGVDPEELGIAVTSRTYFNAQDRRRARLTDVYGPYMRAIESRLSMDDVSPHGYTARFDTDGFLQTDDLTTAQTDQTLIAAGILTVEEVRQRRGLDPRPAGAGPQNQPATPAPAPQEAPAP